MRDAAAASWILGVNLRRWVGDETCLKRLLTSQRWLTRAYFEARYLRPDPWRLSTSAYERGRAAWSMRLLQGRRYATALEVGCGEGHFTARLLDRCERVVAVDLSALALRRARRRFACEPRVQVRWLDIRTADPGGAFDLVFCAELFYYMMLGELADVARRMLSWLKPGGDLCLVHGTSVHDRDPAPQGAAAPGAIGARVLHDGFCRLRGLTVVRDVCLSCYRLTLLRHNGDSCG
jgi:cyclopropane fatty-acyl-phospholipid synthase-like methyltransferase